MGWTSHRARVAGLHGRRPDDPDLISARRDLAAERLAEHITRVVDGANPLSADQRDRLAALLRPGPVPPCAQADDAASSADGGAGAG